MIIKIAIIAMILVAGAILLFPNNLFLPFENSKISDSITHNLVSIKGETVDKVGNAIDETVDKVESGIDDLNPTNLLSAHGLIPKEEIFYGQVISKDEQSNKCQISVPDMAKTINGEKELTHIITIEDCEYEADELVQVIKQHTKGSPSNGNSIQTSQPQISIQSTPSSLVFEALSLTTMREPNNDVMIQYEDTSGKTMSVTVTLRNAEKELFTGQFFASKFATSVNDVSDTPHIIEMVVEHAEHGMITSSVFNPTGNFDNSINGVFTKS